MRREHLDLKASHQQSLGKIKALQDRVLAQRIQKVRSQDFPPLQARTNALPPPKSQAYVEKLDCQTQTGLLPPPTLPASSPLPQLALHRHVPLGQPTLHRPLPQPTLHRPLPQTTPHRPLPQPTLHRPLPQPTLHRPLPQPALHTLLRLL